MKKLLLGLIVAIGFFSCTDTASDKYTGNQVQYQLFQASDFNYTGLVTIKELIGGNLELNIRMEGDRGDRDTQFPAHLHFGGYDTPNAQIAFMLNPVDAHDLESTTVLEQLTDGNRLLYDEILGFKGHVKVHLASDGPDYETILVAGNIGALGHSMEFNREKMAICGKDF